MDLSHTRVGTIQTNPLSNDQSTADTIAQMRLLIMESVYSHELTWAANQVLQHIAKATPTELDLIRGAYWWVKHHLRFSLDENMLIGDLGYQDLGTGKDLLISPRVMVQHIQHSYNHNRNHNHNQPSPSGDCDDFSMLLAALLIRLGVMWVYFCTVAADKWEPDNYSHVYVKVVTQDGSVVALDASHGQYPGWETGNVYKSAVWPIVEPSEYVQPIQSIQPSLPIPTQPTQPTLSQLTTTIEQTQGGVVQPNVTQPIAPTILSATGDLSTVNQFIGWLGL